MGRGRQARLWPGEAPQVPSEDLASVLQNAFACPGGQQPRGGGKEGRGFWASLFQCLTPPPLCCVCGSVALHLLLFL